MELRIRDKQEIIDTDFGQWLIPKIRTKLISNIRKYHLDNWDKYLTTSPVITRLYNKSYKAADVILFAASNLICTGTSGEIVISFKDTFVPGFDRVKLDVLVRTINYGTLDTKGCSIFTDTLNEFADNIEVYARLYYMV